MKEEDAGESECRGGRRGRVCPNVATSLLEGYDEIRICDQNRTKADTHLMMSSKPLLPTNCQGLSGGLKSVAERSETVLQRGR